jgi:hypothetical protein
MNRQLKEALHNVKMNKRQLYLSYHDDEMTTDETTINFSVYLRNARFIKKIIQHGQGLTDAFYRWEM